MGSPNPSATRSSASPAGTRLRRTIRRSSGSPAGLRATRPNSPPTPGTRSPATQTRPRCSGGSPHTSGSATPTSSRAGTSWISISPTSCSGWQGSTSRERTLRVSPARRRGTPSAGDRYSTSSAPTGRCTRPRRSPTGSTRLPARNSGRRRSATAARSPTSGAPTLRGSWSTTAATSSSASGSIERTTSSSSTARSPGTSGARSTGR